MKAAAAAAAHPLIPKTQSRKHDFDSPHSSSCEVEFPNKIQTKMPIRTIGPNQAMKLSCARMLAILPPKLIGAVNRQWSAASNSHHQIPQEYRDEDTIPMVSARRILVGIKNGKPDLKRPVATFTYEDDAESTAKLLAIRDEVLTTLRDDLKLLEEELWQSV